MSHRIMFLVTTQQKKKLNNNYCHYYYKPGIEARERSQTVFLILLGYKQFLLIFLSTNLFNNLLEWSILNLKLHWQALSGFLKCTYCSYKVTQHHKLCFYFPIRQWIFFPSSWDRINLCDSFLRFVRSLVW